MQFESDSFPTAEHTTKILETSKIEWKFLQAYLPSIVMILKKVLERYNCMHPAVNVFDDASAIMKDKKSQLSKHAFGQLGYVNNVRRSEISLHTTTTIQRLKSSLCKQSIGPILAHVPYIVISSVFCSTLSSK